MTTDDELRELIALGDKATARPWNCDTQLGNVEPYTDEHEIGVYDGVDHEDYGYDANGIRHQASIGFCYSDSDGEDALNNAAYITAAANLAPDIARELIEARELPAKITEISELASEMWYRLVIIANDMNNWEVYLEFVDPSDEGIEGESISVYADTMIAAIDKAIRRLKCGDL